MTDFSIRLVDPEDLYELRRRVLRSNDPTADAGDERDNDALALHVAGFDDGRLVVSSSFYVSPSPIHPGRDAYQLRYMATDFDVQGKGYGALVLNRAQEILTERGVEVLWANARDTALGFYLATGWSVIEGSEHLSPYTGLPHTDIYKFLVNER